MTSTSPFARVLALAVLALAPVDASACQAPFNESWTNGGTIAWSGSGNDCALEASVGTSNVPPYVAVAHYRRAQPVAPLRFGVRIAPPPVTGWNTYSEVTVLRGTAAGVPADGPPAASLFSLSLYGNLPATRMNLGIRWACDEAPGGAGMCATSTLLPLDAPFPLQVTLEYETGEAADGRLSLWLGEDTSAPATFSVGDLDNARWGGVERVTLGLSDLRGTLPEQFAGNPVVFDRISASEPHLFWSDFELGAGVPVEPNRPPFAYVPGGGAYTTCDGVDRLPVIASGSTALFGPVDIHPVLFSEGAPYVRFDAGQSEGARAALCSETVSPTSACTHLMTSPAFLSAPPGRYSLVVGNARHGAPCFGYSLMLPLGRH